MASSKSFESFGSMVMMKSEVRSIRSVAGEPAGWSDPPGRTAEEFRPARRVDHQSRTTGPHAERGGTQTHLGLEAGRGGAGLLDTFFRELLGKPEGLDHGLGFNIGESRLAQNLGDDAFTQLVADGVGRDLDDDLVAGAGVLDARVLDNDGLGEFLAVGKDEPEPAPLGELAGEAGAFALDDLENVPGDVALAVAGGAVDLHADAIAGEGVGDGVGRDENVALAEGDFRDDEAEAAGILAELADDLVGHGGEPGVARAVLGEELAVNEVIDRGGD